MIVSQSFLETNSLSIRFVQPDKFDESGIRNCGEGGNDSIQFKLTRSEANRLRDRIVQVLPNESSPIWFHISSDPLNILDCRPLQTTVDYRHEGSTFVLSCQFGSLRSYNLFYSHASFNNKVVDVTFRPARQNPDSLVIEFDKIRLVIPFDAIQKKNILVNKQKKGNGVFVLIPLRYIPYMYRLEPVKSDGKDNQNSNMKQVRYGILFSLFFPVFNTFSFVDYVLIAEMTIVLEILKIVPI